MYIQMYGCADYGYTGSEALCTDSQARPVLGALFFVSFVLLGTMIILNLFIGVIMNGMNEAQQEAENERRDAERAVRGDAAPSLHEELEQINDRIVALQEGPEGSSASRERSGAKTSRSGKRRRRRRIGAELVPGAPALDKAVQDGAHRGCGAGIRSRLYGVPRSGGETEDRASVVMRSTSDRGSSAGIRRRQRRRQSMAVRIGRAMNRPGMKAVAAMTMAKALPSRWVRRASV